MNLEGDFRVPGGSLRDLESACNCLGGRSRSWESNFRERGGR